MECSFWYVDDEFCHSFVRFWGWLGLGHFVEDPGLVEGGIQCVEFNAWNLSQNGSKIALI
jgi:hypothetical protein